MAGKLEPLAAELDNWLAEKGYHPDERGDEHFDAVYERAFDERLYVQLRALDRYRSQTFQAMVGDAILRFKTYRPDHSLLLAFAMKQISAKALADLQDYTSHYLGSRLNWFLMDERGTMVTHLNGETAKQRIASLEPQTRKRPKGLFSFNNQWLLKVLLLAGIDEKYWCGPNERPSSIVDLSRIASVPQPSVSKFAARFEDAGFLRRLEEGFRIVRHRELLEEWYHAEKQRKKDSVGARFLYPGDRLLPHLDDWLRIERPADLRPPPVYVSHHLACHLMDLGRSNVQTASLHADVPVEEVLSALDLAEAGDGPVDVVIHQPPADRAVTGGNVFIQGAYVCDILQNYLEVRASRARGEEQADYILERVLMPHFERTS